MLEKCKQCDRKFKFRETRYSISGSRGYFCERCYKEKLMKEIVVDTNNRQFTVQNRSHNIIEIGFTTNVPKTVSDKKRLIAGESFKSVEAWSVFDVNKISLETDRRFPKKHLTRICWYCGKTHGGTKCPYCGATDWLKEK